MGGVTQVGAVKTVRVFNMDVGRNERWEALAAQLPDGLIYHHPLWLEVLQEAFGCEVTVLAAEDSTGALRGILPLCYSRGLLTGRRYSSLPRTPMAGPLAADGETLAALVERAVSLAQGERGGQLQLKMLGNGLDGVAGGVIGAAWRQTYMVKLPERPEDLRFGDGRNRSRIKWALNKAARLGVGIREAETARDLRAWYTLYLETSRWHALPPRPYRFFEILWDRLRPAGLMRLLLAEQRQAGTGTARLLAGSLNLMFGQTVFYAYNARRREDLSLRPNDLLQWQSIRDACADGYRWYDLGEVTHDNLGLMDFKSKWGAETRWLYRYYYPSVNERDVTLLEGSGRLHDAGRHVWRKVPLFITELVGDAAHRFL